MVMTGRGAPFYDWAECHEAALKEGTSESLQTTWLSPREKDRQFHVLSSANDAPPWLPTLMGNGMATAEVDHDEVFGELVPGPPSQIGSAPIAVVTGHSDLTALGKVAVRGGPSFDLDLVHTLHVTVKVDNPPGFGKARNTLLSFPTWIYVNLLRDGSDQQGQVLLRGPHGEELMYLNMSRSVCGLQKQIRSALWSVLDCNMKGVNYSTQMMLALSFWEEFFGVAHEDFKKRLVLSLVPSDPLS